MRTLCVQVCGMGVVLAMTSCRPQGIQPPGEPFSYAVDPIIMEGQDTALDTSKGTRPLAAIRDEDGQITLFIANEVILAPQNDTELNEFLNRYGGDILETDEIPAAPVALDRNLTMEQRRAQQYTIRLDPSDFDLSSFEDDAEASGFEGSRTISSEDAARLLALMMHELRNGLDIAPNFVMEPHNDILWSTEENPIGITYQDAIQWPALHFSSTLQGSKSGVTNAWQFLVAHGIQRRVNVAIIDGGFWLDSAGFPMSGDPTGVSDLPFTYAPFQYDFDGDDYFAGGSNPAKCTDGSPCPWHGNQSASTAVGMINNRYGAAGTGGTVAEPFLFKADIRTRSQVRRAVRTAEAWGVDVVSMSFGGSCGADCVAWPGTAGEAILITELSSGIAFVASAGNDNENVGDGDVYPCTVLGAHVICVGALSDGGNTRISYSNYGSGVDIFAPTNIPSMPNGTTTTALASAGGTSASAPFVAGVVAMLKALDPSLTAAQVGSILKTTAWTDSTDSRVPRYINALAAVKEAAGNQLPEDGFEPNDNQTQAKTVANGDYDEMTIGPDFDFFRFTLDDYYIVDVTLRFMAGLGDVKFNLVGTGAPSSQQTIMQLPNGRTYRQELMGPGTYTYLVSGTDLNHYHMKFVAAAVSLDPDQFEVNDTHATAASPPNGSYQVNLHTTADVDHYAFSVTGALPVFVQHEFAVYFSDLPLTLTLFRDGAELFTLPPTKTPSLAVTEPGDYVVRIVGADRTRYSFKIGTTLAKEFFEFPVPVEPVWIIDPTGPVSRWLIGREEALTFNLNSRFDVVYTSLALQGDGLHLTLYDTVGNVIAEGENIINSEGLHEESLSLAGAAADSDYLLQVQRIEEVPVEDVLLPAVQYSLSWN